MFYPTDQVSHPQDKSCYYYILISFQPLHTLKFAGDLFNGIKMHTCRYGMVYRMFGAITIAIFPKPVFETIIVIVTTQYQMCFEIDFRSISLMAKDTE